MQVLDDRLLPSNFVGLNDQELLAFIGPLGSLLPSKGVVPKFVQTYG